MSEQAQGVNVVGFFRAEFGQGEAARRVVAGLERARLPFTTVTYDRVPHRQEHPFAERDGEAYPSNIVCLNPEHLVQFSLDSGRDLLRNRYSAGLWFWETSRFPAQFRHALDYVDEVWVASDFVRETVARETSKPVLTFPLPVLVPEPPELTRADLGLPEDPFVFLFVFDFFSTLARKNPLGLIEAFTRAFPDPGRALLYLKSINGSRAPSDLARVQDAAAARPDIVLSDGYVDVDRLTALTALCDCYVSLHRSEGFGLTIAEAMAFGKPAIATAYSGNLAFMDEESSYLVPYTPATLDEAVGPYPAGTVWADPDLDEAAGLMRHVVDDPDDARRVGALGKAAVEDRQSLERATEFLGDRVPQLDRLRLERDAHETAGSRAAEFLAFGPSLSWEASSRGFVGRAYRRVLQRLLRPYTMRQRELETQLVHGIEDLERSRDSLDSRLRSLDETVGDVQREIEAMRRELYAEPYVAGAPTPAPSPYAAFEAVFRGPEERVRELLEPYVELLREHAPVLDLGCGRGELLELLAEAAIEATGVDADAGMAARCSEKGLRVEQANAIDYLERQAEGSLGAVTAIHVFEHLGFEGLGRTLAAARRTLRPGGILVAETINPHSLAAFKTFWVDPTHHAPLFPEVLKALALIHGFEHAEIRYPRGSGDDALDRTEQNEYALVATSPART
jgi:glycosyltransferase involved in cell wall biosynthesis/2-polyprenyl-3-methyl-5-hydroxy-6-metoxy-1,4-benzoquinol methylase